MTTLRSTSFGQSASKARSLLFTQLKLTRFNEIVEETFTDDEGNIELNRNLQMNCNQCDVDGDKMLFAQASKKALVDGSGVCQGSSESFGRS